MKPLVVEVPGLHTVSESNAHEDHWKRVKRVQAQHEAVLLCLDAAALRCPFPLPVEVTLTRYSAGHLDEFDNLPSSLKHVADAVAWWVRGKPGDRKQIGRADGDETEIRFRAVQEKVRRGVRGVRIEIAPARPRCAACCGLGRVDPSKETNAP